MFPRIVWVVGASLLCMPVRAQELAAPTKAGEMAFEQLLAACRAAGAIGEIKADAGSRVGPLIEASKLPAVVAARAELLASASRDALLYRLNRTSDEGGAALIALLAAIGKANGDELAAAQAIYYQGRTEERQLKYEDAIRHYNRALEGFVKLKSITWRAAALHRRGSTFALQKHYDKALDDLRRSLASRREIHGEEHADVADTLNNIGVCLENQGDFAGALEHHLRAFAIRKKARGEVHADVAMSLYNLAKLHSRKAQHKQAVSYFEQRLGLLTQLVGDAQPLTMAALQDLAISVSNAGESEKSLVYHRQLLERRIAIFGESHVEVGRSHGFVGIQLSSLKRYDEASAHLDKAVAIFEATGPAADGLRAVCVAQRGNCQAAKGNFVGAIEQHQEALAMRERASPDSPAVADSMASIATNHVSLKRFEEALSWHEKAWTFRQRVLGDTHASTLASRREMGVCQHYLGRLAEALAIYNEVLEARRIALGHEHQEVANIAYDVANALTGLAKHEEAKALFEESWRIRIKQLGADDPQTLASRRSIGFCEQHLGRYDQSLAIFEEVLGAREKTLAAGHADIATSVDDIAGALLRQQRYADALTRYEECWLMRKASFGDTHADTLIIRRQMGVCQQYLGRLAEALAIYNEVLDARRMLSALDRPDLASSYDDVGNLLWQQRNYAGANDNYTRSWEIRKRIFGQMNIHTHWSRRAIGNCLRQLNRFEAAQQAYEDVYAGRVKLRGEEHPEVADALIDIGEMADKRSHFDKARECYHEALRIRQIHFGEQSAEAASAWRSLGSAFKNQGRYADALAHYRRASAIYEKLPEGQRELATTLSWMGGVHIEQAEYDRALECYQQGLTLREQFAAPDSTDLAYSFQDMGYCYRRQSKWKEAIHWYERALAVRVEQFGEHHLDVAETMRDLGLTYELKHDFTKALERYQRALDLRQKLLGDQHERVADVLTNIGNAYKGQTKYAEALSHYERALAIRRTIHGSDSGPVSDSLGDIGQLHEARGEYGVALDSHQQVLAIRQKVFGGRSSQVAYTLGDLGRLYTRQGDLRKALDLHQQALDIRRSLFGDSHPELAWSLEQIGYIWYVLGEYQECINAFSNAVVLREKVNTASDPLIRLDHLWLANAHQDLGSTAKALRYFYDNWTEPGPDADPEYAIPALHMAGMIQRGMYRYASARKSFQAALVAVRKFKGDEHPEAAQCLFGIGMCEIDLDRYRDAIPVFEDALRICQKVYGDKHVETAWVFFELAVCHANIGHYQAAHDCCETALDGLHLAPRSTTLEMWSLDAFQHLPLTVRVLRYRGWVLEQLLGPSPSKEALLECDRNYGLAAAVLARVREATLKTSDSRIKLAAGNQHLLPGRLRTYRRLFKLEPNEKYLAAAFSAVEEGTARVFLETLGNSRAQAIGGLGSDVRKEQEDLALRLKQADAALATEQNRKLDERKPERIEELLARQRTLEEEKARFVERLEREFPRYASMMHPKPCSLEEARACLDENEVALFYVVEYDDTHLLLLEREPSEATSGIGLALYELPRQNDLSELVAAVLDEGALMRKSRRNDAREEAYRALLGPVEEAIRGKNLVIVPSGDLCHLPFELLSCPNDEGNRPKYLIENCQIRYAPSLTVLHMTREWERTRAPAGQTLWVLGDPIFDKGDPRCGGEEVLLSEATERQRNEYVSRSGRDDGTTSLSFPRLRYSGDEVGAIANLFPAPDTQRCIGRDATEAAVKRASEDGSLARARYVHFATHGILGFDNGRQQSLVLGLLGNDKEDGFLQLDEVTHLKLNADLVVLSACNTGKGRLHKGEGVSGLARAFLHAGSRGVLCSLWAVDDRASGELMAETYRRLAAGSAAAAALRGAQLDMIAHGKPPRLWAPYILIGE